MCMTSAVPAVAASPLDGAQVRHVPNCSISIAYMTYYRDRALLVAVLLYGELPPPAHRSHVLRMLAVREHPAQSVELPTTSHS